MDNEIFHTPEIVNLEAVNIGKQVYEVGFQICRPHSTYVAKSMPLWDVSFMVATYGWLLQTLVLGGIIDIHHASESIHNWRPQNQSGLTEDKRIQLATKHFCQEKQ